MTTTWIYLESHCLTCSLTQDCTENYPEGMKERRGPKCCKIMAQHRVCINLEDIYDPCTFLYVQIHVIWKIWSGLGPSKQYSNSQGLLTSSKSLKTWRTKNQREPATQMLRNIRGVIIFRNLHGIITFPFWEF